MNLVTKGVPCLTDLPYLFPRYKERLETKYIKPRKQRGSSETLVGSSWTFLEKGGDDFRDGLPPEANYNYVKKVRVTTW